METEKTEWIKNYWGKRLITYKPQKWFKKESISSYFLQEIGLPITSDFVAFSISPPKEFDLIRIDSKEYFILGSVVQRLPNTLFVLDPISEVVYFYSESLFEARTNDSLLTYLNKNVLQFLIFGTLIHEFAEKILDRKDNKNDQSKEEIILRKELKDLSERLNSIDPQAFLYQNSYWNSSILELDLTLDSFQEFYPIVFSEDLDN